MNAVSRHLTRCFVAGVVALLPVAGLVLTVAYMENVISESWRDKLPVYFPGMGLLATIILVYLVGLIVSTFFGRWIWGGIDLLLRKLPVIGRIYATLRQILGYGEGEDAIFQRVVMVPAKDIDAEELGLVTNQAAGDKLMVFVPGSPTPTTGRLVLIEANRVRPLDITVNDALKTLVSVGKTAIPEGKTGE